MDARGSFVHLEMIHKHTKFQHVKFGADLTMHTRVTTAYCFMVAHKNSPRRHSNAIGLKLTIFIIKHHQHLKAFLTIFEVDVVKCILLQNMLFPVASRWCYDYD